MAFSNQPLFDVVQIPGAQTTVFTASTRVLITSAVAVNSDDALPYTFSLNLVPSGGAAGAANLAVNDKQLLAKESYTIVEVIGQAMDVGDFISVIAGSANKINLFMSGLLMA